MRLSEKISNALHKACIELSPDVLDRLAWAREKETEAPSLAVLDAILNNLEIAKEKGLPMCQDTGMFLVFVDIGKSCSLSLASVEQAILDGCAQAVESAYFRRSVVAEPVFSRMNTTTNLPPVIWWNLVEGENLVIQVLLKGFGSENCSSTRMLNPTGGEQAVIDAVMEIVRLAQGKPCPPIFVGVGLGGSMDRAAYLSKRALLRDSKVHNASEEYARLEDKLFASLQTLGIGSGGLGGIITALNVAIEQEPTHIAGLPLAVSINCWADRKAKIVWEGEDA